MTDTPITGAPDSGGDILGGGDLPVNSANPGGSINPMPAPAQNPTPWRAILQGALFGLAGAAQGGRGRQSFASGLAEGAASDISGQQKQFAAKQQEAQTQADVKFKSAQAASMVIDARYKQAQLDNLPQAQQDEHNATNVQTLEHLKNAFPGLQVIATNNDPASITAAMASETKSGQGVPPAIHLNVGRQVFSIPLDQEAITNSGGAALEQVNDMLKKQGGAPISSAVWASSDQARRGQLLDQAIHFGNPLPSDETLAQYQNYLATAKANKDSSSVAYLQPIVDKLQQGVDAITAQKAKSTQALAAAGEAGKESTPGGQEIIAKNKAEAAHQRVETTKAGIETQQIQQDMATVSKPDVTGFTTTLSAKDYEKRDAAFRTSKPYQNLQQLQGSYQQFQEVQRDLAAGKDMTGAQSVVGLFNAIGISATPLAGKGFRINQNTIEEHVGARGVQQAGYQKLLSLKNGDIITPQQLKDYASIAADTYRDAFVNAANEAHARGLKADFLPQGNNENLDHATAGIFLKLAGGDQQKAVAMANANGWK